MAALQDTPLRIPEQWSPTWFRQFVVEVLAKADVRNAQGDGVTVSSDGNSVATISSKTGVDSALLLHDGDPAAHENAFNAHKAQSDPHPQYVRRGEGESFAFFLGE